MTPIPTRQNQGYILRDARLDDAKAIEELADSVDIAVVDDIEKEGFLAANYNETDYRRFIEKSTYSFVLESHSNKEIVGFLVACASECIDPKDEFNMNIKHTICNRFVTVRQVFVSSKKEHRRKGLGRQLYNELFCRILEDYQEESQEHDGAPRPVFADIVKTPVNVPSRDFHFKTGFDIVGEFTTTKDNRQRFIFCNKDVATSMTKN